MYRFFVAPEQIGESEITIEGSDVNHIKNVLRMHPGEEVRLCTGQDSKDYRCELAEITDTCVRAKIMWMEENGTELPSKLYLFQGLPKSDKMEWIIQKAVELGVYEIIPVATKRAVVKLDGKKEEAKRKRWNAISESAAKQSKRMIIPAVTRVMTFAEAVAYAEENCAIRLIPYERAEDMDKTRTLFGRLEAGESIGIMIGPEGGFEEAEVMLAMEHGAEPVTLGRRILRTETAGMTVLSALMFQLEGR